MVEHPARVDAAFEDVGQQLGDVGARRREAAAYALVAGEELADRQLDAVRDADVADRDGRRGNSLRRCRCGDAPRSDLELSEVVLA